MVGMKLHWDEVVRDVLAPDDGNGSARIATVAQEDVSSSDNFNHISFEDSLSSHPQALDLSDFATRKKDTIMVNKILFWSGFGTPSRPSHAHDND